MLKIAGFDKQAPTGPGGGGTGSGAQGKLTLSPGRRFKGTRLVWAGSPGMGGVGQGRGKTGQFFIQKTIGWGGGGEPDEGGGGVGLHAKCRGVGGGVGPCGRGRTLFLLQTGLGDNPNKGGGGHERKGGTLGGRKENRGGRGVMSGAPNGGGGDAGKPPGYG